MGKKQKENESFKLKCVTYFIIYLFFISFSINKWSHKYDNIYNVVVKKMILKMCLCIITQYKYVMLKFVFISSKCIGIKD